MDVLSSVKFWLVSGAVAKGGSWGGPECRAYVPDTVHLLEDIVWILFTIAAYYFFDISSFVSSLYKDVVKAVKQSEHAPHPVTRFFELASAGLHFTLYGMVLYYKLNLRALINMIQPCPLIVLFQGIALYDNGPVGVMITLFILPALIGALLATALPDTSGLDQFFETEAYYVQHYSILVMPFLLLSRRNFLALKFSHYKAVVVGWLILFVSHFVIFETIDLLLGVNVEFMLCPTGAMTSIFPLLPFPLTLLLYPSHRTALTHVVNVAIWPLSYFYIGISGLIQMVFFSQSMTVTKTKMKENKMK